MVGLTFKEYKVRLLTWVTPLGGMTIRKVGEYKKITYYKDGNRLGTRRQRVIKEQ